MSPRTTWLVAAAIAASGCGLSAFDDRRDEAWSDSSGPPGNISSADYGVVVDSVSTEQAGATIVVLGLEPPALATVSYDQFGALDRRGLALDVAPSSPPLVAGARDVVTGVVGLVALATPGAVALFDARSGLQGPEARGVLALDSCGAGAGETVAALTIAPTDAGDLESPDLVAAVGSSLVISADVDPDSPACARCDLGDLVPVAITNIDLGGPEGDELIVAAAAPGSAGALLAFSTAALVAADGAACPAPLLTVDAPDGEGDFGARVVAGDLDADDIADIAATARGGAVIYAIRNLEIGAGEPAIDSLSAIGNSGEFGTDLEMIDLDGDEGDELIAGDPGADPEGVENAGSATIFALSDDSILDVAGIIFDSTPEAGQRFGRSLSLAEFVAPPEDTDLLLVGASGELFTYFRSLFEGEDPR